MAGVTEAIARTEERRYPRGTVVVVDDGCPFEARVVAEIGVVAGWVPARARTRQRVQDRLGG